MKLLYALALLLLGDALGSVPRVHAQPSTSLTDAYRIIQSHRFVDLTHDFAPGIAHWPGFANETVKTLYWYTPKKGTLGSGFFAQEYCHVGQAQSTRSIRRLREIPTTWSTRNDYKLESWILHHGHYQIELLANLDRVPESGALAMVTFPKPRGGAGFPARVIAIVP